ncbi:MAG: beta strand repeat-containing protein, partial [Gaiellaceae bacterium]
MSASDGSSHTISASVSGTDLAVTIDGTSQSQAIASVTSLTVIGGNGDDSFTIDSSLGTVAIPIVFDGGSGSNTLNGPAGGTTTWNVTGADSGTVGGVAFTNFGTLVGAPTSVSTFDVEPGGSVSGKVDGGTSNTGTVNVDGHRNSVEHDPTDAHSGTVVVDGTPLIYSGMAPVNISSSSVTITGSTLDPLGNCIQVAPDGSGNIVVSDLDSTCSTTLPTGETTSFAISGTTSVTFNAGTKGKNTVEFTGDFVISSGATLVVNAQVIKVDHNVKIDVGTGDISFNASYNDNGTSILGITTTLLGDNASIDLDQATLTGNDISLTATSGTLKTTVDSGQTLTGSNDLTVASTDGFDSNGTFVLNGNTCSYTGTDSTHFKSVTGCNGSVTDKAAVQKNIDEMGAAHGIDYSAVQLIYGATVDIHGASTITAGGNVTISSAVDVTATAESAGNVGYWQSGNNYAKDAIVIDSGDSDNRYQANSALTSDTTEPKSDLANWTKLTSKDASIAAAVVVATATSQLSGTSSIVATNGDVNIGSTLNTNITTTANSSGSASGAGVGVGVVVTDSEAYIDSTATEPVNAKNLTVSADTSDSTPTTGVSSPGGSDGTGDTNANSPGSADTTVCKNAGTNTCVDSSKTSAANGKADGKSTTSDGSQDFAAALAVTVLVATTQAYISPADQSADHTVDVSTGAVKVHAGATVSGSATADGGNVKFSPDAPTVAAQSGGSLTDGTTYYYEVSAIYAGDGSSAVNGTTENLGTGMLDVSNGGAFD